jgi:predicted SprT family Zn-dependent metalloprotease
MPKFIARTSEERNILENLFDESIKEMTETHIKVGNVLSVEVNYRAKNRMGLCRKITRSFDEVFAIQISNQLFGNKASIKETLLHELLHTCTNCFQHKNEWKYLAGLLNRKYGYNIQRTLDAEQACIKIDHKYKMRCKNCGNIIGMERMSDFVKHPEKYMCKKCRGNFERIL